MNRYYPDHTDEQIAELREVRVRESKCDLFLGDAALVHEIARGQHRQAALLERYATLVLCSPCHRIVHQGMTVAEQLAWVWWRRPKEYDLAKFFALTGRNWPSGLEVLEEYRRISDPNHFDYVTPCPVFEEKE